ncbi:5-formyltetrahydrofolate cyclo-ligase [Knoellia sp. CPCC 206435]|uniref:5-formyltetrahydrofolate cyclo-ligase n=1 Tax=Knoellia terrae TaxID=3404797 RepID=UPI003B4399B4
MSSASRPDAKTALRPGLVAARRERVAGRDRAEDDAAIAREVLAVAVELGLGPGDTVTAYEAWRSEPPTAATITALAARGIRVIVPVTLPDKDLDWCDAADDRRRPLGREAVAAAGLVLTPGLAVDTVGTRLGRGGGSYDRALARRGADARVLAVLHPGEVQTERLPADAHDEPVDGVLTADGTTWF